MANKATKNMLSNLEIATDEGCGLCSLSFESHNHFSLECLFSKWIWGKLLDKCGFSGSPQNLTWVKNHGEGIRVFRGRC